jgi:GntR family transcriptional regulator
MMSNMSVQVKHARVSALLAKEIIGGSLTPGSRLPGEHELAARFEVSRGTIRQALARLEADGLIEKHPGAGSFVSFVSFEGHRLDKHLGWSRALAAHGVQSTAEILRMERLWLPELAAELRVPDTGFLALDRRRRLPGGEVVSLERSRLPWLPEFESVVTSGLYQGSLTATLAALGLRSAGARERVELVKLDTADAVALCAEPGAAYLACTCTRYSRDGRPIERVTSVLDPRHFSLETSYGYLP